MSDHSFRVAGKTGKGALLVHGLTGAPGEMKYLAKKLHKQGYAVYGPQLAGHGADQESLLHTTWRDWLDSLREAYESFSREVDEVYVAGICVGGALGLELAAERPEIRAAAVYSMTFEYDGWNMPRIAVAAPVIQTVANLPLVRNMSFEEPYPFGLKDERLRERVATAPQSFIEGALDRMPMGSLYQMYRLCRHVERIGKDIRTPTLILHAREDDMSHLRNAYRLRDALGGPVEVGVLEDCYHMIHVDKERDLVADWTARFFEHARPAPAAASGRASEAAPGALKPAYV
ncbi:MAG: alpha/beta fold hydrolase [Caulobacteraceae bacterium]|nr:alpha/beta fold hydrolase [Caulobacteraceae bacterium]